jgi:apolipoprotein N-acyltransferase
MRSLAVATGLAAALAHPPFGLLPGLLAYGLLMHLWDREGPRPLRSAFLTGFLAGIGYFGLGVWWVAEAFLVDAEQTWMAPFAVIALAGGLALFWGLAGLAYRWLAPNQHQAGGPLRVLWFAGVLTAAEWLRGHVLTGFPWNLPGETWLAGSAPSQAAAVFGAYGLTWITLAIAAAITVVLENDQGRNVARAGVAALVLLYIGGAIRLASPPPADTSVTVRIVQPNVEQKSKYDQAAFADIVDRYLRLTAAPATRTPDIVIWPEGAIPAAINDYLAPGTWTRRGIADALQPGQTLLVGAYRLQGDLAAPVYFNSLIALQANGIKGLEISAVYDKFRLVPGGEYLPMDALLGRLGIKKLVHVGDGFTPGPTPAPMTLPGLPLAQPLICYESLFPGFTREGSPTDMGLRPRWIVNVSNDAWFGATSGPLQHLNLASYRAIEEGLPMVRATPTGISAVIDARGRMVSRLGAGQVGVIDAALPAAAALTLYARLGELSLALMMMISAAFAAPLVRLWARF